MDGDQHGTGTQQERGGQQSREGQPPPQTQPSPILEQRYLEAVKMKGFGTVASNACRNTLGGSIQVFDFGVDGQMLGKHQWLNPSQNLRLVGSDVDTRLVLLEDASPLVLEAIGAGLEVSPLAFDAHLRDSGYDKAAVEQERPDMDRTWTKSSSSTHHSLKWFRPVIPAPNISDGKRMGILTQKYTKIPCVFRRESKHPHHNKIHCVYTDQNIFRRPLNLSFNSDTREANDFPVGWEERVTIWKKRIGECTYGQPPYANTQK